MTHNDAKPSGFFQRHGWKVILFLILIIGMFAVGDILQGMSADTAIVTSMTGIPWEELQQSDPQIANLINLLVRSSGAQFLTLAILSIFICVTAYRRGERWAWYAFWAYPLFMVLVFITMWTADRQADLPPPPPMVSAPIFFTIFVLVLLLSYRRFFPSTAGVD